MAFFSHWEFAKAQRCEVRPSQRLILNLDVNHVRQLVQLQRDFTFKVELLKLESFLLADGASVLRYELHVHARLRRQVIRVDQIKD